MSADKKRFKLSFGQIEVEGPGFRKQRALVIAVSQIPGVQGWLNAVLAVEDGSMQVKPITEIAFELSKVNLVALVEIEGERAAPIIYTPDNKPAAG